MSIGDVHTTLIKKKEMQPNRMEIVHKRLVFFLSYSFSNRKDIAVKLWAMIPKKKL